ncbi:MAG: S49 family peptidase, partial [candidate division Zixibacteria bacterium]|nr:S49 family peptidase [candidate division Zixibacteria bacterium]
AGKANLASLYDKLDIHSETYLRGRNAGMYSMTQPYTPQQREKLKTEIKAFYRHLVGLVASSQALTEDSVDALGQGRVWTGVEATNNGLATRIGGLMQALEEARRAGGLDPREANIEVYPEKHSWWENPFDLSQLVRQITRRVFGHGAESITWPAIPDGRFYCRLPYDISIR